MGGLFNSDFSNGSATAQTGAIPSFDQMGALGKLGLILQNSHDPNTLPTYQAALRQQNVDQGITHLMSDPDFQNAPVGSKLMQIAGVTHDPKAFAQFESEAEMPVSPARAADNKIREEQIEAELKPHYTTGTGPDGSVYSFSDRSPGATEAIPSGIPKTTGLPPGYMWGKDASGQPVPVPIRLPGFDLPGANPTSQGPSMGAAPSSALQAVADNPGQNDPDLPSSAGVQPRIGALGAVAAAPPPPATEPQAGQPQADSQAGQPVLTQNAPGWPVPKDQFEQERSLNKDFTQEGPVKDFQTIGGYYNRLKSIASTKPNNVGDLSLLYSYMRIIDPGSVVRESQFQTTQDIAGLPAEIKAARNKLVNGGILSNEQRQNFIDRADQLYDQSAKDYNGTKDKYDNIARQYNMVSPERITGPYRPSLSALQKVAQHDKSGQENQPAQTQPFARKRYNPESGKIEPVQ